MNRQHLTASQATRPVHPSADRQPLRVAITGGTSGLGLAMLRRWHAVGARCAFVARDASRVQAVARELPGTVALVGDVGDKAQIHRLALQITGRLGGLDVLVNNASTLGPVPLRPLADTDCEALDATLAVNLLGPFRLGKALLGSLAASARDGRGGLMLNIGSDAGVEAYPGWGAYGCSKAALQQLSRIWDAELAPLGVQVWVRDPGDMDTPMHAAALPESDPATLQPPADVAARLIAEVEATLTVVRPADATTAEVA